MQIAADRLKSDKNFWSFYLVEFDQKKLNCSEEEFYKLCLCKIPKTQQRLKRVSKYCNIDYEKLKNKINEIRLQMV